MPNIMELELKAYKCVFPEFYTDAYNQYMWEDPKQHELIFGKTRKEAVKQRCINDESYTYWELKQHIKARRFPDGDLYSQEPSKIITRLNSGHINHLTHSLGVKFKDVCPREFYRNYSMYYEKNKECEFLVDLGLMENWQKLGSEVYAVTEKGIEAVKTLLLINNVN